MLGIVGFGFPVDWVTFMLRVLERSFALSSRAFLGLVCFGRVGVFAGIPFVPVLLLMVS